MIDLYVISIGVLSFSIKLSLEIKMMSYLLYNLLTDLEINIQKLLVKILPCQSLLEIYS